MPPAGCMQGNFFKGELNMFGDYRDAAFDLNDAAADLSDRCEDAASCSPATRLETTVESDRAVVRAAPVLPRPDAVRALLVLAAESAFALQLGTKDSLSVAQLKEGVENLEQMLGTLPEINQGVDYGLVIRRARQTVAVMNETVRREVLEKINENTAMDELKATLQVVKDTAVEAGRALKILDFSIR